MALPDLLHIPTADGRADALAAVPGTAGPHPAVLMYPDGFGIRPALRQLAGDLAARGYYVLVPNVFYRDGPTPVIELPEHIGEAARPAIFARLMPMIKAHTAERTLRDAAAYLDFLAARPEVRTGPVAVTGYCIGGLLAVRTAAAHPGRVAALAAFHAPVAAAGPDVLSAITAEVHFGHAADDLTPEQLRQLNEVLDAAGITYSSEIYPGTVHGFTMPDTDAFDPAARQHHWDRLLALLDHALPTG
ncbi:dienelactone hydrolase family protein [Dactylosporangium vinaceum]|uniref:Dienelactone hydrolase family protein n=1 Tax=Dactylosporangium vinaceum TaxID=53362 RepID=A0ABV5MD91_9ACTN|nr:dienelactone hydrolase family protein [Dactylosporangium vinaceum]UAC00865.1 dienelactone hydrolase family protein [Dactylosporangium vinaceum]